MNKLQGINLRLFFFGITLILISCSPIRRHSRLVEKYPFVHEQDTVIKVDTVTILVPKNEIDTVFFIDSFMVNLYDTIVIEKERLKLKMYAIHDSILIDAKCDTVFVEKIIERKIPIRYYEKSKFDFSIFFKILIALLILLGLYLIRNIFRK